MKILLLAGSLGWLCGEGPFELELCDHCLGRAEENQSIGKLTR